MDCGLLDSIFELLKGASDPNGKPPPKLQAFLFSLYADPENDNHLTQLLAHQSALRWWQQLWCPEIQQLYLSGGARRRTNNHAFTSFLNYDKTPSNETIYLCYIKPALRSPRCQDLLNKQKSHLRTLLTRGVVMWDVYLDPTKELAQYTTDHVQRKIEGLNDRLPAMEQEPVFGEGGLRSRFLLAEMQRKGRAKAEEAQGAQAIPKDSHRKTLQRLPGAYDNLTHHYNWFSRRVSGEYLENCTDMDAFFHVLSAAFVLGLNVDNDGGINDNIKLYLKRFSHGSSPSQRFEDLLQQFCAEQDLTKLGTYPSRLSVALRKTMAAGCDWEVHALSASLFDRQNPDGDKLDRVRSIYLDWLRSQVDLELLNRQYRQMTSQDDPLSGVVRQQLQDNAEEIQILRTQADQAFTQLMKAQQPEQPPVNANADWQWLLELSQKDLTSSLYTERGHGNGQPL